MKNFKEIRDNRLLSKNVVNRFKIGGPILKLEKGDVFLVNRLYYMDNGLGGVVPVHTLNVPGSNASTVYNGVTYYYNTAGMNSNFRPNPEIQRALDKLNEQKRTERWITNAANDIRDRLIVRRPGSNLNNLSRTTPTSSEPVVTGRRRDPKIKEILQMLIEAGYGDMLGKYGADGIWGENTQRAWDAYQAGLANKIAKLEYYTDNLNNVANTFNRNKYENRLVDKELYNDNQNDIANTFKFRIGGSIQKLYGGGRPGGYGGGHFGGGGAGGRWTSERWTNSIYRRIPSLVRKPLETVLSAIVVSGSTAPKPRKRSLYNKNTAEIQQMLIDNGYGDIVGKVDGIWGKRTQRAWDEFVKTQSFNDNPNSIANTFSESKYLDRLVDREKFVDNENLDNF